MVSMILKCKGHLTGCGLHGFRQVNPMAVSILLWSHLKCCCCLFGLIVLLLLVDSGGELEEIIGKGSPRYFKVVSYSCCPLNSVHTCAMYWAMVDCTHVHHAVHYKIIRT